MSASAFLLEGSLKRKENYLLGSRWMERFYQLSSNKLVEKRNSKSSDCLHDWDISFIGVVALSSNGSFFNKDQRSSCMKIVLKNGEAIELLAKDPQIWVSKIKNIQKRKVDEGCAKESISRITEFMKDAGMLQREMDQDKVQSQLELYISKVSDLIDDEKYGSKSSSYREISVSEKSSFLPLRITPEISREHKSSDKQTISSMEVCEKLKGFNKLSIAYTELQTKSIAVDKQLSENRSLFEQLSRKVAEVEKEIEEMRAAVNGNPDLLQKEQELLEREQNVEKKMTSLKNGQLATVKCDTALQKQQEKQREMEQENHIFHELQRKKEEYIALQEQKLRQNSLTIKQRDVTMNREAAQLRQKIMEYNQRVLQLNNQARVLENAEKEVRRKTEQLERRNRIVIEKSQEMKISGF